MAKFIVDQGNIELGDFVIGIASTVPTMLLDGAGIGIGSVGIESLSDGTTQHLL